MLPKSYALYDLSGSYLIISKSIYYLLPIRSRYIRVHASQIPSRFAHFLHTPIRTRSALTVLPTKQRVCLIRQYLTQHHRLIPWKLSGLLKDVVARHGDNAPADVVVVLDSRAVDVFFEPGPADG